MINHWMLQSPVGYKIGLWWHHITSQKEREMQPRIDKAD